MTDSDSPGVKIPPPLCFLLFFIVGIFLNSAWIQGSTGPLVTAISGGIIFVISSVFLIKTARKHKQVGSNIEPWKPTTTIIVDGAYKYSRNPIYVAMAIAYAGIAISAYSLPALFLLPVCLGVIWCFVISKEEAYLEDKFGEEYLSYKMKVRRWL